MNARNATAALALALLAGCSASFPMSPDFKPSCTSDEQCPSGLVCFADGCGDPGQFIAVELLPSTASGEYPQDTFLPELRPFDTLYLYPASTVRGTFYRGQPGPEAVTYSGQVSLRFSGESTMIPGQTRSLSAVIPQGAGRFVLPIGNGNYTVTATAEDPQIPPSVIEHIYVDPSSAAHADVLFPATDAVLEVRSRVLYTISSGLPVDGATLEVQAFDPVTQQPISQKAAVAATGEFTLHVFQPADRALPYVVRVNPKEPNTFVPRKEFPMLASEPSPDDLELGNFGLPIDYTGRVINEDGQPIANAAVYCVGKVEGGGTFRSPTVTSDADGRFTLRTLPSAPGTQVTLWAVPPDGARSGVLKAMIEIPIYGGVPLTFVAPDKTRVRGSVYRPDGTVSVGVRVVAVPLAQLDELPLPTLGDETRTDANGRYELLLDPAVYRLDFVPTAEPRNSRILRVQIVSRPREQEVPPFWLSRGRTAQGQVLLMQSGIPGSSDSVPSPFTSVRFFRTLLAEGGPTAQLLGEAVTDAQGQYKVLLPARTEN